MNFVLRHSRGLFVALLALGFSATLALAGQPSGSPSGLAHASSQVDQTEAPDASEAPEATDAPEATEAPDASEAPVGSEAPDASGSPNCATDPTTLTPQQLAAATHGSIVCWAAQQPTPSGYPNHGAWVKHW